MGTLSNSRATTVASENDDGKIATINGDLQILDSLEAGKFPVTITTADVTLAGTPASPQAQNKFFDLSGTLTGNRSLIFPVNDDDPPVGNPREIIVKNGTSGAFTVTVKVSGQTGVPVTQGHIAKLLHDGTDFKKLYEVNYTTGLISIASLPAAVAAHVYNDANLSIADNTLTTLTFNQERYDPNTIHSTSSNTDRLTLPYAGKWRFGARARFAANAVGIRELVLYLNGSTIIGYDNRLSVGGSVPTIMPVEAEWNVAVNDYVIVKAKQNSGGSLNVEPDDSYSPDFWCSYIGA